MAKDSLGPYSSIYEHLISADIGRSLVDQPLGDATPWGLLKTIRYLNTQINFTARRSPQMIIQIRHAWVRLRVEGTIPQ